MLRRLTLAALALTGVPLVAAWLVANGVLHPKPRVEDHGLGDFNLTAEDISFPSRDGTPLAGWFIPAKPAAPAPAIVLSHGWARSRAELLPHAAFLHRAGFAVLAFDYRHRGESGGDAITMGLRERDDLRGALDALATRPEVDAGRIGVMSLSMGSVIAILVAAEDDRIRALAVECPYSSYDAAISHGLRHYYHLPIFPIGPLAKWVMERRLGQPLDTPDAVDVVAAISPRPIFFIADENDAVVGSQETERVFAAAADPKRFWLIPNADHSRGWQAAPEEYEQRVIAFLREALMPAVPHTEAASESSAP